MAKRSKQQNTEPSLKIGAEHMRVFVAIGQSQTLTEAASSLQLPLFSVSRVLKRIESTSKLALVRRDGSGLELTDAGRDYFSACLNVLEAHQGVADVLEKHRRQPEGTLKISTPIPFAVHVLSVILPKFQQLYPGLNIDLNLYCSGWDNPPKAADDITFKVRSPKDSRHHLKIFPSIRQALFASPDYLSGHPKPTHPQQLEDHVCLGLTRDPVVSDWQLVRASERIAINPKHAVVAQDMEIMARLAVRSAGVAVLPLWRAHTEVMRGTLLPVLPEWAAREVEFCALHGGRLRMASREAAFLNYLSKILATPEDPRCQGQDPNRFFVLKSS